MLDIIVDNITLRDLAFLCGFSKVSRHRQIAYLSQASLLTNGESLSTAEFQTIVFFGVVGRGNHDPGLKVEFTDSKIQPVSGNKAKINNIHALVGDTSDQSGGNLRGGETHIAAYRNGRNIEILGRSTPYTIGGLIG